MKRKFKKYPVRDIVNRTQNYSDHFKTVSKLSIADIVRIVDYINLLAGFVDKENEILDNMADIIAPFNDILGKLRTAEQCRHQDCGGWLYKSDLPQYDFVCIECDENF